MSNTAGGAKSYEGRDCAIPHKFQLLCPSRARSRRARAVPRNRAPRSPSSEPPPWRILISSLAMLSAEITAMRSRPDDLAGIADLAHLGIEVLGGVEQVGALLGRAGDLVFPVEQADADSRDAIVAHAPCSIALRRPIIASTRARTCSFFCSRLARSEIRLSWRWRRARFSSFSWLHGGDELVQSRARGGAARHRPGILRRCRSYVQGTIGPHPAGKQLTHCAAGIARPRRVGMLR